MKIALIGATGRAGGHVLTQAPRRGGAVVLDKPWDPLTPPAP